MSFFSKIREYLFGSDNNDPAENPTFVRLVQVIKEDQKIRDLVIRLIQMDSFNRSSVINSIIHTRILQGDDVDHLKVLHFLTDEDICNEIRKIIET